MSTALACHDCTMCPCVAAAHHVLFRRVADVSWSRHGACQAAVVIFDIMAVCPAVFEVLVAMDWVVHLAVDSITIVALIAGGIVVSSASVSPSTIVVVSAVVAVVGCVVLWLQWL